MSEPRSGLRLAVLAPYYPPHVGGVEAYASELNARLASHPAVDGITVLTSRLPRSAPAGERAGDVDVHRVTSFEAVPNFPVPVPWSPLLWRTLRRTPVDVVISHTRFFTTSALAWPWTRARGAGWIHVEHGSDFVQSGGGAVTRAAAAYDRTLGRAVLRQADERIAISRAVAEFIERLAGMPSTVLYRGVDAPSVDAIPPSPELAQRLAGRAIVAFVGRLINGKGVEHLIRAMHGIRCADWALVIVGEGPERQRLQQLADKLEQRERIVFLGERSHAEAIAAVKVADVVVNPSLTEGLPTSVIEAALCSSAIVATDVGGTREIVTPGSSAVLVPPRSVEALRTAITGLIGDPQRRRLLGDAARAEVIERFDWNHHVEELVQIAARLRDGRQPYGGARARPK